MLVSSDEIEPEIYFWYSTSTESSSCVCFLLYTESRILNRVEAGLTPETWAGRAEGAVVATTDVDDFWLRYRRICES